MTNDDVLFGFRVRVFDLAARTGVSHACRVFGLHRSTFYAWKQQVDRHGLEMLRPRERRRPLMPNQTSRMVEERILAFAIAHPGLGPRRVAAELGRIKWGGIVVSPSTVWRVLRRHGPGTRSKRLSLVAGYAAPYEPPRQPDPERHIDVDHPGELVGIDCCYIGRLRGTNGAIWQLTATDIASAYGWAQLVVCPSQNPTPTHTSRFARHVARALRDAGWRLERVLTDNGNEFKGRFPITIRQLGAHHTRSATARCKQQERVHRPGLGWPLSEMSWNAPVSWTAERWAVRPGREAVWFCQGSRSTESRIRRSFGVRRSRCTPAPIGRWARLPRTWGCRVNRCGWGRSRRRSSAESAMA